MRVVDCGLASGYREVMEFWDLDEVLDAHEILDLRDSNRDKADAKAKAGRP